jgi:hemerythrin superfamily protein
MTTADNDVTTLVLAQHKEVAKRLDAVHKAPPSERAAEFDSLAALLDVHETAEETVIYPVLRKLGDDGTRIADARTTEEDAAKEVLGKLKALDAASDDFAALFTEFSAKVHAHATSEEGEVIPLLTSSVSAEERQAMGSAFVASQVS